MKHFHLEQWLIRKDMNILIFDKKSEAFDIRISILPIAVSVIFDCVLMLKLENTL